MRRKLEKCKDKRSLINLAVQSMQDETDRLINIHADNIKNITESFKTQIRETKKKQWVK